MDGDDGRRPERYLFIFFLSVSDTVTLTTLARGLRHDFFKLHPFFLGCGYYGCGKRGRSLLTRSKCIWCSFLLFSFSLPFIVILAPRFQARTDKTEIRFDLFLLLNDIPGPQSKIPLHSFSIAFLTNGFVVTRETGYAYKAV